MLSIGIAITLINKIIFLWIFRNSVHQWMQEFRTQIGLITIKYSLHVPKERRFGHRHGLQKQLWPLLFPILIALFAVHTYATRHACHLNMSTNWCNSYVHRCAPLWYLVKKMRCSCITWYKWLVVRLSDPKHHWKKGVPSAESSCSVRGLGKGVSGKPYPRLCNARRPRLEPGTFRSQAVRLYRLHQARPS